MKYKPVILGSCPNSQCNGVASVDFILLHSRCPDCDGVIDNRELFEDIVDSQYLRDALKNVSDVLNKLTQGEVPPKLWKSTLLKIQSNIQEVIAEENIDIEIEDSQPISEEGEPEC